MADVRRWPRSRRHPQFDGGALATALERGGVAYAHLPELGGRRRPVQGSPNDGWRIEPFRGYADHLASEDFARGLARLEALAFERATAIMCAEALWWRCHRRLVADVLTVRGWVIEHIGPDGRLTRHALPAFATAEGGRLTYPAEGASPPAS